ncbi:MAG: glycosyltransferase [Verrucomicrobiales bacterium]
MRIACFTNTYLPHVGGVARSVATLEAACRSRGHDVRVVAPDFENAQPAPNVLRVPAIQNFNGSDFSVRLPIPSVIREYVENFHPDIIHSHHPFLLGDAALRESWKMRRPLVFTHHTLYERYTHYVPLDSPALKRAAIQLATEYANLCDQVIAPSASIAEMLRERGVETAIEVIPTGVDTAFFAAGDGARFRQRLGLDAAADVIGHVGRLAREKNLMYLAEAVALRLRDDLSSVFLLVGDGDVREEAAAVVRSATGDSRRVVVPGKLIGQDLADAYAAMDCFAFASQTETQGLVLAEAMAAGCPVVALDGPGVREIVQHGVNGYLLAGHAPPAEFAAALRRFAEDTEVASHCSAQARQSALAFDTDRCLTRLLACYERLVRSYRATTPPDPLSWDRLLASLEIEWNLIVEKWAAAAAAMSETGTTKSRRE